MGTWAVRDVLQIFREIIRSAVIALTVLLPLMLVVAEGSMAHVWDKKESSCARVLQDGAHRMINSSLSPDLTGHWVSYRCEIRSGPVYVLRHFSFVNNTFESVVYHYEDSDCHVPSYAVHSRGSYKLLKPSWTVLGATDSEYEVTRSYVITYSSGSSLQLSDKLSGRCFNVSENQNLRPYSRYLVYSYSPRRKPGVEADTYRDVDCFRDFQFTLNELQLVMVETRSRHGRRQRRPSRRNSGNSEQAETTAAQTTQPKQRLQKPPNRGERLRGNHQPRTGSDLTRQLFLGAVHSMPEERQSYRPSSFQPALIDPRNPSCEVCYHVMAASAMVPPRLPVHSHTLFRLDGEWASTRCESREYGMFLTRWLHFLSDGRSWQAAYDHYHDALCRLPSFSLHAKGRYSGGTDSGLVTGAKDYIFKATRLKVIPRDRSTVGNMNHYNGTGCGRAHAWGLNQAQDVTRTGGCVILGIQLPHVERIILKMEASHRKEYLYMGQRFLEKSPGTKHLKEWSSAFHEALVKCDQADLGTPVGAGPGDDHTRAESRSFHFSAELDDFVRLVTASASSSHFRCLKFTLLITIFISRLFKF